MLRVYYFSSTRNYTEFSTFRKEKIEMGKGGRKKKNQSKFIS